MNARFRSLTCLPILALALSACSLAPEYTRPDIDTPTAFKEDGPWRPATQKLQNPEKWWLVFGDPQLNKLEDELNAHNLDIKVAEAQYRSARAAVTTARASLFPTLDLTASQTKATTSASTTASTGKYYYTNSQSLTAEASWEVDLWGKVRNGVDVAGATMEASEGALGAARLSAQALLATDYFQLRALDAQIALYERTVESYKRYLELTRNRLMVGVVSQVDVAQAETQLNTALTSLSDARLSRSQYEHALAILVGKLPSALNIASSATLPAIPSAPALVPSTVLESRYDIYQYERKIAAANAQIGVNRAAYFPVLNLTADAGLARYLTSGVFSAPVRVWSLGPSLALNLFDGGTRRAAVEQAEASYDEAVATYRSTVLIAFQEVEDNLVAARQLAEEDVSQRAAVAAARKTREIYENQYKAGIVGSLNVISAQTTELSAESTALSIWNRRMAAAVKLFKNLGGRQITDQPGQKTGQGKTSVSPTGVASGAAG